MPNSPEISVIVGAHSREEYLPYAIRSMTAQTLPRERFEIVVIKDFRSAEVDRELERVGATVLFDEEPRIGRWLSHAVRACRAPVVTFCDDDDEFEPERLSHLLATFDRYPDLGFYRNRVTVIDRAGRPIPPERWRTHERDDGFDSLGPVYVGTTEKGRLLDLATQRTHATFNSSTMAVRRELLDGDVGEGFERTQLPDQYLFLAAVLAPRGAYLDDRRLTRYRYYPGNVTREVFWLGRAEASYRDMADVADRHGHPEAARWLSHQAVHYGRMFRGGTLVERVVARAVRREVAQRTGEYLRYLGQHPEERRWTLDTWAAGAYGLGYVPFAPLVARLARARVTARTAS
jgi:glycosyltransferase involved in cell wall biosynthesis